MKDIALFAELEKLATQQIGLRIPDDARDRFISMLRERATYLGCSSLKEYQTILLGKQASKEWEEFARVFTSGETFFFRDHGQFDLMRLRLLPELIALHRSDKTLRLWSAGCASGEEAYSMAMLVDMLLQEHDDWNILILGTDIGLAAIAKARLGCYGQWSFRMVPPALQQRYFHLEGSEWLLDERIRRMVTFRASNLVGESFPNSASELHDMDLILCRNVFIYFNHAAVSAVTAKFAATLHDGGYLLTAHTELIGHSVRELKCRLFAEGVVYQRCVHVPVSYPNLSLPAGEGIIAPSLVRSAGERWGGAKLTPPIASVRIMPSAPLPVMRNDEVLLKEARAYADRGEYEQAEQVCRKILSAAPLATAPYFLLAQLAQLRGDFEQAIKSLNNALYLDPLFVAAHLELAALYERGGDIQRAQILRHSALGIVCTMPNDKMIEQYERTAGELAQWLAQWELSANNGC